MRRLIPMFTAALIAVSAGSALAAKEAKMHHTPALQGYCPVAYVAAGKAVKGLPKFSTVHDGHLYLFASADAKKMYDAAPDKFQVKYEGWCATAVSVGKKVKSDPSLFTVHEGKAYLFSNADAKKAFDDAQDATIQKADEQWPTLAGK